MVPGCSGSGRSEQGSLFEIVQLASNGGQTAHKFESRLPEPAQHLSDGVFGLVRVQVLICKPRPMLTFAHFARSQVGVDPFGRTTCQTEESSAKIRHETSICVVESNDDVATRPYQRHKCPKSALRIAG